LAVEEGEAMKYQKEFDEMRELVLAAKGPEDVQARVVISLHKNFPHYNWVGIYRLEGENLVLGPFRGKPTVHTSIPVGRGICGAAAVSAKTEVVPDVGADARYLACSLDTQSEIVVPVIKGARLWGEIDIDSDRSNAFGPDDVEFLEAVARLLSERM
jgi:putative methionine-R-sulfoxide reductase with GAF domain